MSRAFILVVDDEPDIRSLLKDILSDEGYEVATAEGAQAARAAMDARRPDLVLLDIWMPDGDGVSLLREWSEAGLRNLPVVMISGHGTIETAVEAVRLGAYDFLEKPLTSAKLLVTIENALRDRALRQENIRLRLGPPPVIVGASHSMRSVRDAVTRIAPHNAPVLLSGEPGSGRQLVARAVHIASRREGSPFVAIHLRAFPGEGAIGALFGTRDQPGAFEEAADGTIYLDDLPALDAERQDVLIQVLDAGHFSREGQTDRVPLRARFIASVGREPAREVADGKLRAELFYRLNTLPIAVPSLSEHREDVPELANFLRDELVERERLDFRKFSTGALNALRQHDWPGNVRELRNVVQRLLILGGGGEITPAEVAQSLDAFGYQRGDSGGYTALFALPLGAARERFERAWLEHHVAHAGGDLDAVARVAGLDPAQLHKKLSLLGLASRRGD
jgi:DNA-binding NtrC family response regulator